MKIAIYGDSFADPFWNSNSYKSWPELLAESYNVTNFAKEGSSLWWSYDQLKRNHLNFDYNIFVGTIYSRVYLEDLNIHLSASNASWPVVENDINLGQIYFKYFFSPTREYYINQLMIKDILTINNAIYIPVFEESIPENTSLCPLNVLSKQEEQYYNIKYSAGDRRKCHLTKENNLVIYNKLITAISNKSKTLELSKIDYNNPTDPVDYYFTK
jgi:hypothetical protein